nr:MAG TPA: hypothetical protein [Caudoviricetes sp.]
MLAARLSHGATSCANRLPGLQASSQTVSWYVLLYTTGRLPRNSRITARRLSVISSVSICSVRASMMRTCCSADISAVSLYFRTISIPLTPFRCVTACYCSLSIIP